MTIEYACTYIDKEAEEDQYEHGCVGKRSCLMAESCNITADTLPGLLAAIGKAYCLDIDDVWLPGEEGSEDRMSYNRLETDDGDEPSAHEMIQWKAGKLRLWLADYDFLIEKREVGPIPTDEFTAAGIKWHD